MSAVPLRLGLAGLGTVGIGVVKIIQDHADLIARRTGRPVVITAVSARDRSKNRDADLGERPGGPRQARRRRCLHRSDGRP
jgi:homoserine dehydrogenase